MTDQQRYEEDARAWLTGVDVPPHRLQVGQLVVAAQRSARRRRRLVVGGTGLAVLVAVVAVPAAGQLLPPRDDAPPPAAAASPTPEAAPIECTVTELELPNGLAERGVAPASSVEVTAMDPTGHYVVGDTYGGFSNSPVVVLWDDGSPTVIPETSRRLDEQSLPDSDHYTAVAVNARGEVVGDGARRNRFYGWIYRDGQVTELTMPDGFVEAQVAGINEAGDVVGIVQDPSSHSEVVVWPAESPERPRFLDAPDGEEVSPAVILDDGTVVGWFHGSTGGYVWSPDGVGRELPLPAEAVSGTVEAARGQWAVGSADFPLSEEQVKQRLAEAERNGLTEEERAAEEERLLRDEAGTLPAPVRWDLRTGAVTIVPGFQGEDLTGTGYVGNGGNAVNPDGDVIIDTFPGYSGSLVLRADGREVVLSVPTEDVLPAPIAITDDGSRLAGNLVADREADRPADESGRPFDESDPEPEDPAPENPDRSGFPEPVSQSVVWDC